MATPNTKRPMIRSAYSGQKRDATTINPSFLEKEAKVQTEFQKEVNINEIMKRAKRGQFPPSWMTSKTPYYGDFTQVPKNYQEAFDVVLRAKESFEGLPLEFRKEIGNDPRNLATAPKELWEKYGLLKRPKEGEAPTKPETPPPARPPVDRPAPTAPGAKKAPPADAEEA